MTENVEFEWDYEKAEANRRKHGIPFPLAIPVFRDPIRLEQLDQSLDYGEDRWIALGCVDREILHVVFTLREQRIRLISARRATRNEQRIYWAGHLPS
jgi:uncharacterized DUF497 family protein